MNMTARDKKVLIAVVPVALLVAYWFLLLAPKREEASTAATNLTKQEQRRDRAQSALSQAKQAETSFTSDYGEIVRLGKAIPAQVDMPSLLVQLEGAAAGTGIQFTRIATGERQALVSPAPAGGEASAGGTTPTAAGGATAQSGSGTAAEAANTAAAASNQSSEAAEQSGVSSGDVATSTSAREGGLPVGGGTTTPSGGEASTAGTSTGLETVPLELEFVGNFFNLADFFHDVKRFVHVVNTDVIVNGRLVTIDSVNYKSDPELFPRITAQLKATIYLSPTAEGTTAGATPQGPAATTPAAAPSDASTAPVTPTAAATP